MRTIEKFIIISFESTHMAIKSEKLLLKNNHHAKIIPVPREITASCGLALRVKVDDYEVSKNILEENQVKISGFYLMKREGLKKEVLDISDNL
jgi:hypothetical protein